jgi:pimeloyl-ACP methyl ester carboxylesterase
MIDRRLLLSLVPAALLAPYGRAFSQGAGTMLKRIRTSTLEIAYEDSGPAAGTPVLLMHGFPYDPRAYDEVVPPLVAAGCRTVVPYLRGYGPTRFLTAATPRSGQQAALGRDLLELMDGLRAECRAVGYDWVGGQLASSRHCGRSARAASSRAPAAICEHRRIGDSAALEQEHRLWYQYYFHTERGRAGLQAHRRAVQASVALWSPNWFDDATYERTAPSFDNPDFVEAAMPYRHRFGYALGDPVPEPIEARPRS